MSDPSPLPFPTLKSRKESSRNEWKLEFVDLMKGGHKSPEYMQLQPFEPIPVLKDADLTLFEKFKGQGTALLGKDIKERALVNRWWEVEAQNFSSPTSQIMYEAVFSPMLGSKCNDEVVAQQVAKLDKVLDVYEAHLAKSKYLTGDSFTLADMSHLPHAHMLVNATGKPDLFTSWRGLCALVFAGIILPLPS